MKQRYVWLDAIKGIGILSVIFLHTMENMSLLLYAMPLFFIVSGYLHRPVPDMKSFFLKNAKRMLLPYLVFFLLIGTKDIILSDNRIDAIGDYAKLLIWGGNHMKGELSVFWYIDVLFISLMAFNFMCLRKVPTYFYVLLYLLSFLVDWLDVNLPWNIQSLPLALCYMYVGSLFREHYAPQDIGHILSVNKCVTGGVVTIAVICVPGIYLDIKYNMYGVPVLSFLLSIAVVVYLALLCGRLKPAWPLTSFLAYCGKASLFLMFIHQAIRFSLLFIRDNYIIFVLTVILSVLSYYLASRFKLGRILLCGENSQSVI